MHISALCRRALGCEWGGGTSCGRRSTRVQSKIHSLANLAAARATCQPAAAARRSQAAAARISPVTEFHAFFSAIWVGAGFIENFTQFGSVLGFQMTRGSCEKFRTF